MSCLPKCYQFWMVWLWTTVTCDHCNCIASWGKEVIGDSPCNVCTLTLISGNWHHCSMLPHYMWHDFTSQGRLIYIYIWTVDMVGAYPSLTYRKLITIIIDNVSIWQNKLWMKKEHDEKMTILKWVPWVSSVNTHWSHRIYGPTEQFTQVVKLEKIFLG